MTIKYIKSLLDNKLIYKQNFTTSNTLIYSPYNGITDSDEDYYNHLNNILKSGLYLIKHHNQSYILLMNKYIFKINREQLIILSRLLNFFNKSNDDLINIINNKLTSMCSDSTISDNTLRIFSEKVLSDQIINNNLNLKLNSLNCIGLSDSKCCFIFLLFIIDCLVESYKFLSINYQTIIRKILNNIFELDFDNAKFYMFNILFNFRFNDQSIAKMIGELVFTINELNSI